MARIYGEIVSSALMTFDKSFSRSNGQPLDSTEVFYSLAAAQDYAATDVAYVGQKIVVIETKDEVTTVAHYGIEADGSLKELGAVPVGDGVTVEVVDGKIQLAAMAGHTTGTYQPFLVDGKIVWREPSATTVEGLDQRLTSAEDAIEALEGVVGDEAAGLVKGVADNAAAIAAEVTAREEAVAGLEDKIGEVEEGKTVAEMISDAQAAATYNDTQVKADIQANADAIDAIKEDYLKAEDKTELQDNIDTLAGRVTDNEEAIAALNGEGEGSVKKAIDDAFNDFATKVSDDKVVNTYKELIDYAAENGSEVTTLIGKVSTLETEMDEAQADIQALETSVGTKAEQADLDSAVERITALDGKAHEHANSAVLDSITSEKVGAWDAAEQNAKDYADGLNNAMGTRVGNVETALAGKVAVEAGKSLVSDTLISKLEGVAEGAQVNVIDTVDEAQFAIADKKLTLLDVAIGKVTGLQAALDGKANKGTTLAEYGITDAYTKTETEGRIQEVLKGLSDTSETAASVAQALETYKTANDQRVGEVEAELATKVTAEEGKSLVADTLVAKLEAIEANAQVNKIESVKVGETVLEIVDKAVVIPVGAGLKASDEITIAEDGSLGIGEVGVGKLVDDGATLILNGGTAIV